MYSRSSSIPSIRGERLMSELITVKMTGVIPTAQYANLQPEIEAQGKSYEEAQELALQRMTEIWNRVCEPGKELKVAQPVAGQVPTETNSYDELVSKLTGAKVMFDSVAHKYITPDGKGYLSGSVFAGRYKNKFELETIANSFSKKHNIPKQDILDMWSLNGDVSSSLGTAVHNALELYGKYLQLSLHTKGTNESALTKNVILQPIVEAFYKGREEENAGYEVFVADEELRLCGFIDRLLIVDEKKKICRVQDYKTNHTINKAETIKAPFKGQVPNTTLGSYWLQLSFYAFILQKHGWTVEGLDIFNWEDGEWKLYQNDVIDISSEVTK